MARRRDEGWTWLDWLGLIIYLAAWYVVLRSMLVPSQFALGGYEIRLSGFGLLAAASLGVLLLAVLLSGLRFRWAVAALMVLILLLPIVGGAALPPSPRKCPIYIFATNSSGGELVLENGTAYSNLTKVAIVYELKPGSVGGYCEGWDSLLFGPYCCWVGRCHSFYSNELENRSLVIGPVANRSVLIIDDGVDELWEFSVSFSSNVRMSCKFLGSPQEVRSLYFNLFLTLIGSGIVTYIARLWSGTRRGKPRGASLSWMRA